MRADLKNGKTVITLHEADKRALQKASTILGFVGKNVTGELATVSDTGSQAIGNVLTKLCAETPENDTGAQVERQPVTKPDTQPAKQKVA